MNRPTLSKAATMISMAMALVVALLAVLGSDAVGVVAVVGALVAGALYAASGLFNKDDHN
jgi:Kef-type K+ transport system membrane component KefB